MYEKCVNSSFLLSIFFYKDQIYVYLVFEGNEVKVSLLRVNSCRFCAYFENLHFFLCLIMVSFGISFVLYVNELLYAN